MSPKPRDHQPGLLNNWQNKSKARAKDFKRFLQRVETNKEIKRLPGLHDEAFSHIDCLQCAACCKNYSPRFKTPDIKRISKGLGMKESALIDTYLQLDADGDYVLKQKPCPFLKEDNQCGIYEIRPADCRQFPYTDVDVLLKRKQITLKNAEFCPAVYYVLEKLMEK